MMNKQEILRGAKGYVREHIASTVLFGATVLMPATVATLPLYDQKISDDPRNEGVEIYKDPIFAAYMVGSIGIPLTFAVGFRGFENSNIKLQKEERRFTRDRSKDARI